VHGEVIDLTVLVDHQVHQDVQVAEGERVTVRAGGGVGLTGGDQVGQADDRVAGAVTSDELLLELTAAGLGLAANLHCGLVVPVTRTGDLDQPVDFRVTEDGRERARDLREGRGILRGDRIAGGRVLNVAERVLAVVGEGVALDPVERQHLEHAVHGDDVFDYASDELVLSELRRFGQCHGRHFRAPLKFL
jgi:hypothetical protein